MELYHLLAFVLHSVVFTGSITATTIVESRQALTEAILFVGYLGLGCPSLRELCRWGSASSILQTLCSLPIQYFCDPSLKAVLFPTLVCACYEDSLNSGLLINEINPSHIVAFLEEASGGGDSSATVLNRVAKLPSYHVPSEAADSRCALCRRFSQVDIPKAIVFFKSLLSK
jgi:hypothetical protein